MERFHSNLRLKSAWVCLLAILTPLALITNTALAITASMGRPYQGKLKNGIPFPREFSGYQLREAEVTYSTPELVGALLDAIEGVRERYPDTCDLYLGDFSREDGGFLKQHRSHQNGRDVDLGMYARDNRALDGLIPMNEANLDVPKTWQLVENLLQSQKIQYIFVDRSIQRLLYDYAASHGSDPAYLDHLFGNTRGAVIQHVRGHQDHLHVRFFTPWSSLAGQMDEIDGQKATIIEMAQQSYLPKKVNYYVKSGESDLKALAKSFGVSTTDLCRWNRLRGNSVLDPGSCLVFYKRGFELEPVHLAQTLRPDPSLDYAPVQVASISPRILRDISAAKFAEKRRQRQQTIETAAVKQPVTCKVCKGDTLSSIAKRNGIPLEILCRLNGLKSKSQVKAGQELKVGQTAVAPASAGGIGSAGEENVASDDYTVRKGETMEQVAKKSGMDVNTFRQLNGLTKNQALRPGQKLKVVTAPIPKETGEVARNVSKKKQTSDTPRQAVSTSKKTSGSARQASPAKKNNDAVRPAVTTKKTSGANSEKSPVKGKANAATSKKVATIHTVKKGENYASLPKNTEPALS